MEINLDEMKRSENETLKWKPEMHLETGNTEVTRCEIGFDSKPISEMHCKGGTYLKLGVGGGNLCKEGRVARRTRRDERSKIKEVKTIFLELKIDFKNRIRADSQMQENHRKSREQECSKIQFTKNRNSALLKKSCRNEPENEIKTVRGFFTKFLLKLLSKTGLSRSAAAGGNGHACDHREEAMNGEGHWK